MPWQGAIPPASGEFARHCSDPSSRFGGFNYNTAKGYGITVTFAQPVATAGLAYLNPLNIRGEVALGLMRSQPIKDIFPGSGQRDQYGYGIYWRLLVTPSMTVTPGLQMVFDPSFNPAEDVMVIPSIKFRVAFRSDNYNHFRNTLPRNSTQPP